jgi:hypothetical protein
MTNGELFIAENPNIEFKLNGSCVWIYYPDGVNHYTMSTSWWEQEISLFDKMRAEMQSQIACNGFFNDGIEKCIAIVDKYVK